MKRTYLIVSVLLFGVALVGGSLMLSGMSGPHMGAAVFAGYLVVVLGVLGLNLVVALSLVLSRHLRLVLVGAAVAAGAAYFVQQGWHAAGVKKQQARMAAAAQAENDWQETIVALPRAELLAWLKDGTFDARRPRQLPPSLGLWDRAEAMAQSCRLDVELLEAIHQRQPFPRDELLNLLDALRQCPSDQRQEWFAHFCRQHALFAVTDAGERWQLAERLLSLDVSGDYLRQFVAAGYRLDAEAPDHPPLLFEVLGEDEAMLARTRVLIDLGAHREVKNAEGLTPAAFLERRAKQIFSDGELPEDWRATMALVR